jgi:hypothetical protein
MLWTSRRRKSLKFQAGGSWAELRRSGSSREVVSEPERDSRRVRRSQIRGGAPVVGLETTQSTG